MKILLISNFAPPQNHVSVPRIHSWLRDWSRHGHEVTLLTTRKSPIFDGNLDTSELVKEYPKDLVSFIEIPYCKTHTVASVSPVDANHSTRKNNSWRTSFRRFAPFLIDRRVIWFLRVVFHLKKIFQNKEFDVVVSSFPISYSHLIAFIVSRKFNIPWLADYRDPWSCDKIRRAPWPFYLIDWLIEKFIIRRAKRISAVSPGQAELIGNFLNRKVDVIFNGSDDPDFASIDEFRLTLGSQIETIRYVGTVYDNRIHAYQEFFELLAQLMHLDSSIFERLHFEFIGPRADTLNGLIQTLGLEKIVETRGRVSMTEAQELMRESAALLFFDIRDTFKMPGVLSGKIFDYLSARRPIISVSDNPDSDVNSIIKECDVGVVLNTSEQSPNFGELLNRILPPTMALRPNYTKLAEFRRSIQSNKALSILNEMAAQNLATPL